jgi:hypothetical protein
LSSDRMRAADLPATRAHGAGESQAHAVPLGDSPGHVMVVGRLRPVTLAAHTVGVISIAWAGVECPKAKTLAM